MNILLSVQTRALIQIISELEFLNLSKFYKGKNNTTLKVIHHQERILSIKVFCLHFFLTINKYLRKLSKS